MSSQQATNGVRGHHLSVRGASKRYGAVQALSAVDFDVAPGQFLVLLGPSGSGKSTLVRSLAGVERLDSGEVHLSKQVVSSGRQHLPPERRDLAMVFQDYALWPHLTVADNVGYALRRRRLDHGEHRRRVGEALERVGLLSHAERYPSELSGGEQQRVALARAVVAKPRLMLFDEPLSNLDADLRERLRVEISTLTRDCGATAVYITHDQSEAFALADRIGVLDGGHLVQQGVPEDIYRRPATPFVARFTGLAGEMAGTVTACDARAVEVRVEGATIRARPVGAITAGDPVTVLVRPAAATLARAEAHSGHEAVGQLSATVADVAYRGRGYDHVVVSGGGALTSVHAAEPYARGDVVRVVLDADSCLAYPRAAAINSEPADLTTVTLEPPASALVGSTPTRSNS